MSYAANADATLSELENVALRRKALRSAFGQFPTGVTVVTTLGRDGKPRGFTANSFCSVSMDPPLLLVCPAKSAESFPVFEGASHFAVSVLAEDQSGLSQRFASKLADKFDGVHWRKGELGQPLLTGASAWFECAVSQRIDAGDHVILLGEVIDFKEESLTPLSFYKGSYMQFPTQLGAS